jgi:hypothetical protein
MFRIQTVVIRTENEVIRIRTYIINTQIAVIRLQPLLFREKTEVIKIKTLVSRVTWPWGMNLGASLRGITGALRS